MRVWRYHAFHRLAWIILALLVLAVAIFVMATGFTRLRAEASSGGGGAGLPDSGSGPRLAAAVSPLSAGRIVSWESGGPQVPHGRARA